LTRLKHHDKRATTLTMKKNQFVAASSSSFSSSSAGRRAGERSRSGASCSVSSSSSSNNNNNNNRRRIVAARGFLSDWLSKNTDNNSEGKKTTTSLRGGEKKRGGETSSSRGGGGASSKQQQQQQQKKKRGGSGASSSSGGNNNNNKKKGKAPTKERSLRTHVQRAMEKASKADYPAYGTNSDKSITKAQMKPDFGLRRDLHELYSVKDLDDEDPIGAGSYGIVRKVIKRSTGEAFALKTLRKAPWAQVPSSLTAVEYYHSKLRNELECMRQLGASLNVVYLYDAFEDDDAVHLLMDLCEGGELLERISNDEYREADAARLIRAVLRTAAQCHSRGIVFRDIKPDNFLFQNNDENAPLKATDFGLAGKLPKNRDEPLARRCGTPSYMAPEVINRKYGAEADVWSCGVVAYQLLTGRLPFRDVVNQRPNAKEVFRAILEDPLDLADPPWDVISEEAKDFVEHLLERDPKKRPTARAALLHPWLQTNEAQWKSKQRRQVSGGVALGGQVVARLQRFATQGLLKRSVLRLLAGEIGKDLSEVEKDRRENSAIASDIATKKKIIVVNGPIKQSKLTGIDEKEFLELKQLFDRLDTSGDNLVELSELEVGLNEIGYDVTGNESEQLLAKLDTSGDGVVELNEFLAALVDWESVEKSESYPSWVKRAFDLLDEDDSGLLDANEVANFVVGDADDIDLSDENNEAVRRNALIRACIAEADGDGDGQIDVEEFASLLQMDPSDGLDQYDWRFSQGGSYDDSFDDSVDENTKIAENNTIVEV
jgi:calcium-dependent protein kinase